MRRNKGFSLIEILIALVLLGFGMVSLFNLFPLALQSLTYSKRLNEAGELAQRKFEEIKSKKDPASGAMSGREGDMDWTVSVSALNLDPGVSVTSVEVDISFDFQKQKQTERFVTYLPAG